MSYLPGSGGSPTGAAGGVLGGTYPNPSSAVDMASQSELDAAIAGISGIADEVFQTEDDGFDSSTLDAKWTQGTGGTAPTIVIHPIYARSHYLVKFAGSALGSVNIEQAFTPAGDFALTLKFRSLFRSAAGSFLELWASNSTYNDGAIVRVLGTVGVNSDFFLVNLSGGATVGSTTGVVRGASHAIFIHLQRVGTVFTALYSMDGVSWQPLSATMTKTVTIAKILINVQQSTTASKELVGIDWIRRDWFFW